MLIRSGKGRIIPLGCEPFAKGSDNIPQSIKDKGLGRVFLDVTLFKLIYLANFKNGKMHLWLIKTIAPVMKAYPKARMLLCGAGEVALINKARRLIAELGLSEQILIVGRIPRPDVPWALQHSDCAVVPSRSETFGHNFLEPMFAGLPVIGTQVGIGKDIIINSVTGFAISLSRRKSLTDAVMYMLRNPTQAKRMGRAALEFVGTQFRHSDIARILVEYYSEKLKAML